MLPIGLGIVTLSEGDFEIAMDYLGRMTLLASPDGRWASAARLNLAEAKASGRRHKRSDSITS